MNAAIPNYPKRASNRDRILDLLSDGREHDMREMEAVGGMRFGGRVYELRKLGHQIETLFVGPDHTAYRMTIAPRQLSL